jgi:hypothetical protein
VSIDQNTALDHIAEMAEQIREIAGQLYARDQSLHVRSLVDYAGLIRYHAAKQAERDIP